MKVNLNFILGKFTKNIQGNYPKMRFEKVKSQHSGGVYSISYKQKTCPIPLYIIRIVLLLLFFSSLYTLTLIDVIYFSCFFVVCCGCKDFGRIWPCLLIGMKRKKKTEKPTNDDVGLYFITVLLIFIYSFHKTLLFVT